MFVGHIGIIAASQNQDLLPYLFWDTPIPAGTTLTDFNVIYAPSTNIVQIDWGDGSALETINSGINLNHTFI